MRPSVRRNRRRAALPALLAAVALLVPASLRTLPAAATTTPAPHSQPRDLFQALLAGSRDRGRTPSSRRVSLLLLLKDPTSARRQADLAAIANPRSPRYGHYLTLAQYQTTYGPSHASIEQVTRVLRRDGLAARWQRGDDWLVVAGPVRRVEAAFGVRVHDYTAPAGVQFYASVRDPRVPVALRGVVVGASHLSSYAPLRRRTPVVTARAQGGVWDGLTPDGLLAAYDMAELRRRGFDGTGETVVFFESDGFVQHDLDTYTAHYGLPPIHPIIADGPRLSTVEGETEMDLEVVHAIAPGARLVLYNFDQQAAYRAGGTYAQYYGRFIAPQGRMINASRGLVISQSWGICDALQGSAIATAYRDMYDRGALLGETDFVATGDSAAFECLNDDPQARNGTPPSQNYVTVGFPDSSPGVTAVGGTRLTVNGSGSWYGETVWEGPAEISGSAGGLSAYFVRPWWQHGPGVVSQYSNGMRQEPDVAADSDPATGVSIFSAGSAAKGGGTSQAAPIWAGMTVLINQYLKSKGLHTVGFMNPALYALAATRQVYPPFHDVTVGSNLVYSATPGYDMATGLGTPDAWNLARDIEAYERNGGR